MHYVHNQFRRIRKNCNLLFASLALVFSAPSLADSQYDVVHPNVRAPFKAVIENTVLGIKEVIPESEIHDYDRDIPNFPDPIVLTNDGIRQVSQHSENDTNPVFGLAEIDVSESIYGVSLFIEPLLYVELIESVSTDVDKIVFFYNDKKNIAPSIDSELIDKQIELKYISASDSRDALDKFVRENSSANSKTAFIFLRGFIELSTNTVLNFIVSETWKSNAITVTNKAGFVKAGLALGLIPDFKAYGRQIARLKLAAKLENYDNPRVEYLQTDVSVINTRSAKNSSIVVNERVLSSFNFSYPVD